MKFIKVFSLSLVLFFALATVMQAQKAVTTNPTTTKTAKPKKEKTVATNPTTTKTAKPKKEKTVMTGTAEPKAKPASAQNRSGSAADKMTNTRQTKSADPANITAKKLRKSTAKSNEAAATSDGNMPATAPKVKHSGSTKNVQSTNMPTLTQSTAQTTAKTSNSGSPNTTPQTHTTQAKTNTVRQPSPSTAKATDGSDQIIGKDAKGRTLYRGPRGGEYYINAEGNKEYIKQSDRQ